MLRSVQEVCLICFFILLASRACQSKIQIFWCHCVYCYDNVADVLTGRKNMGSLAQNSD